MPQDFDGMRAAIASALSAISGLVPTTRYAQKSDKLAVVGLPRITYDESAAEDVCIITIKIFVANNDAAHTTLLSYLARAGASSVKAAIEAVPTLGGSCSSLRVTEARSQEYETQPATYLTADWIVEIYA